MFLFEKDILVSSFLSEIQKAQIRTIGSELVFGKVFDSIRFNSINEVLILAIEENLYMETTHREMPSLFRTLFF